MQGSVRLHQKHIQQTAFSGYLLPLKGDSQETVQTDQCSHTYYYPTPSSCMRFCFFYKYTPLWRRKNMESQGLQPSGSQAPWRLFCPCCLVPYNFKWPQLGEPTLILFLTAAYVKLSQWLVILARGCSRKAAPTGSTPEFYSSPWGGKQDWRSLFKGSGPPGASPSCTKWWLSSWAWNQVVASLLRLLIPSPDSSLGLLLVS